MGASIRPELSKKNIYWISKHRYYELKYFCLQYLIWKESYKALNDVSISSPNLGLVKSSNRNNSPTENQAIKKVYYSERISLIEKTAIEADHNLSKYILRAVTEGLSYDYLKSRLEIPCGKDMYYDRYRKFFWLLSDARQ